MDIPLILFFAVIAIAIFLFEWGMLRSVYAPARDDNKFIKDRIAKLKKQPKQEARQSLIKDDYKEKNSSLYRQLIQFPGVNLITDWIEQSGKIIKLDQFLWTCFGCGIAAFVSIWLYTFDIVMAVTGFFVAFSIPIIKLWQTKTKRLESFESQLPEALDIITRAIRAGHPFNQTLHLVADELEGAISEEMAVTYAEMNYGVPISVALGNMLKRIPSKPLKSLVTAILLQRETGGNLAEILEKISGVVRGGYRFQRKIKTLSAEGKMGAWVMSGVPVFLGIMMYFFEPELIQELFRNPVGIKMLWGSGILYVIGFFWIRQVIKIEV